MYELAGKHPSTSLILHMSQHGEGCFRLWSFPCESFRDHHGAHFTRDTILVF